MKSPQIITATIIFICASNALKAMDDNVHICTQQWFAELSKDTPDLTIIKQIALQKVVDVNTYGLAEHPITDSDFGKRPNLTIKKYAILEAAKKFDWDLVKILLDAGANPNTTVDKPYNYAGFTPLHYTTSDLNSKATPIALALIAAGADVNARANWMKQSPLRQAIYNGNITVIEAMLEAGAQAYVKDYTGLTDDASARHVGMILTMLCPQW